MIILVLNDGSTWTEIDSCSIVVVNEKGKAKLDSGLEPTNLENEDIIHEIGFTDVGPSNLVRF